MQNHMVFSNRIVCATGSGEPQFKEKRAKWRPFESIWLRCVSPRAQRWSKTAATARQNRGHGVKSHSLIRSPAGPAHQKTEKNRVDFAEHF